MYVFSCAKKIDLTIAKKMKYLRVRDEDEAAKDLVCSLLAN